MKHDPGNVFVANFVPACCPVCGIKWFSPNPRLNIWVTCPSCKGVHFWLWDDEINLICLATLVQLWDEERRRQDGNG